MAITFFGVSATPTDNGTNATSTITLAPPLSMVAGDLVFVYSYCRTNSSTIAVTTTGGQTWFSGTATNSANAVLTSNFFWCRFNGTWSVNPIFTYGASTNTNAIMIVFRPTSGNNYWGTDGAQTGSFVDKVAASSFTVTGWTPHNPSTVNIGISNTDDDNTWTISGTNWINTSLSAQYR